MLDRSRADERAVVYRHAHPKTTHTQLTASQNGASPNPSQHHQTNKLDFADVDVSSSKLDFPQSGPKIHVSICGEAPAPLANS